MLRKLTNTTLYRVQPLLLTVFGIAATQYLFFLLLPLQLKAAGHKTDAIGLVMSFYAFGAIVAGVFGAKVIAKVGHIRSFSLMSAIVVTLSAMHSFYDNLILTGVLRAVAGFTLITNFITLESWLNAITDKSNRGKIFSIYQICVSIGGMSAPFFLNSFDLTDPRLFAMVGVFLSISIIIMSLTRLPMPTISDKTDPMSIKDMWKASQSGTVACFAAGLITSVAVTLITIYTKDRDLTGLPLSLVLSSLVIGGLIAQYPVGWFADRFDKRTVTSAIMIIGTISNLLIIYDHFHPFPLFTLAMIFLVAGGSAAAIFPLSVTQVFDNIDPSDAVRATSTLQITVGTAAFLSPILCGILMEHYGSITLFYYTAMIHVLLMVFLMGRRIFAKDAAQESTVPYQVTTDQITLCRTGLDPRVEYRISDVGDPTIKLLLEALAQEPHDPTILMKSALDGSHLHPTDIAVHLVLALPKHSDALIGILVSLYPELRMEITQSLYEIIILRKHRINALVQEGLCEGATQEEREQVHDMIQDALRQVEEEEQAAAA
ncbi:MAG: MFS transporter [Pseudomonadota bacterium]|nr:MFS transporter [Pseudomonadota bacterium]